MIRIFSRRFFGGFRLAAVAVILILGGCYHSDETVTIEVPVEVEVEVPVEVPVPVPGPDPVGGDPDEIINPDDPDNPIEVPPLAAPSPSSDAAPIPNDLDTEMPVSLGTGEPDEIGRTAVTRSLIEIATGAVVGGFLPPQRQIADESENAQVDSATRYYQIGEANDEGTVEEGFIYAPADAPAEDSDAFEVGDAFAVVVERVEELNSEGEMEVRTRPSYFQATRGEDDSNAMAEDTFAALRTAEAIAIAESTLQGEGAIDRTAERQLANADAVLRTQTEIIDGVLMTLRRGAYDGLQFGSYIEDETSAPSASAAQSGGSAAQSGDEGEGYNPLTRTVVDSSGAQIFQLFNDNAPVTDGTITLPTTTFVTNENGFPLIDADGNFVTQAAVTVVSVPVYVMQSVVVAIERQPRMRDVIDFDIDPITGDITRNVIGQEVVLDGITGNPIMDIVGTTRTTMTVRVEVADFNNRRFTAAERARFDTLVNLDSLVQSQMDELNALLAIRGLTADEQTRFNTLLGILPASRSDEQNSELIEFASRDNYVPSVALDDLGRAMVMSVIADDTAAFAHDATVAIEESYQVPTSEARAIQTLRGDAAVLRWTIPNPEKYLSGGGIVDTVREISPREGLSRGATGGFATDLQRVTLGVYGDLPREQESLDNFISRLILDDESRVVVAALANPDGDVTTIGDNILSQGASELDEAHDRRIEAVLLANGFVRGGAFNAAIRRNDGTANDLATFLAQGGDSLADWQTRIRALGWGNFLSTNAEHTAILAQDPDDSDFDYLAEVIDRRLTLDLLALEYTQSELRTAFEGYAAGLTTPIDRMTDESDADFLLRLIDDGYAPGELSRTESADEFLSRVNADLPYNRLTDESDADFIARIRDGLERLDEQLDVYYTILSGRDLDATEQTELDTINAIDVGDRTTEENARLAELNDLQNGRDLTGDERTAFDGLDDPAIPGFATTLRNHRTRIATLESDVSELRMLLDIPSAIRTQAQTDRLAVLQPLVSSRAPELDFLRSQNLEQLASDNFRRYAFVVDRQAEFAERFDNRLAADERPEFAAFGLETPSDSIPSAGRADYDGAIQGVFHQAGGRHYAVVGRQVLAADFTESEISGSGRIFAHRFPNLRADGLISDSDIRNALSRILLGEPVGEMELAFRNGAIEGGEFSGDVFGLAGTSRFVPPSIILGVDEIAAICANPSSTLSSACGTLLSRRPGGRPLTVLEQDELDILEAIDPATRMQAQTDRLNELVQIRGLIFDSLDRLEQGIAGVLAPLTSGRGGFNGRFFGPNADEIAGTGDLSDGGDNRLDFGFIGSCLETGSGELQSCLSESPAAFVPDPNAPPVVFPRVNQGYSLAYVEFDEPAFVVGDNLDCPSGGNLAGNICQNPGTPPVFVSFAQGDCDGVADSTEGGICPSSPIGGLQTDMSLFAETAEGNQPLSIVGQGDQGTDEVRVALLPVGDDGIPSILRNLPLLPGEPVLGGEAGENLIIPVNLVMVEDMTGRPTLTVILDHLPEKEDLSDYAVGDVLTVGSVVEIPGRFAFEEDANGNLQDTNGNQVDSDGYFINGENQWLDAPNGNVVGFDENGDRRVRSTFLNLESVTLVEEAMVVADITQLGSPLVVQILAPRIDAQDNAILNYPLAVKTFSDDGDLLGFETDHLAAVYRQQYSAMAIWISDWSGYSFGLPPLDDPLAVSPIESNRRDFAIGFGGEETPAGAVPAAGIAEYAGAVAGNLNRQSDGNNFYTAGTIELEADFGLNEISSQMDIYAYDLADPSLPSGIPSDLAAVVDPSESAGRYRGELPLMQIGGQIRSGDVPRATPAPGSIVLTPETLSDIPRNAFTSSGVGNSNSDDTVLAENSNRVNRGLAIPDIADGVFTPFGDFEDGPITRIDRNGNPLPPITVPLPRGDQFRTMSGGFFGPNGEELGGIGLFQVTPADAQGDLISGEQLRLEFGFIGRKVK